MILPKVFISSVLLILFTSFFVHGQHSRFKSNSACESLVLNVDVVFGEPAFVGLNTFNATVRGEQGKVRFFLFNEQGTVLNDDDYFKHSFSGLKSGKYTIVVVDSKGCSKETQFKIQ